MYGGMGGYGYGGYGGYGRVPYGYTGRATTYSNSEPWRYNQYYTQSPNSQRGWYGYMNGNFGGVNGMGYGGYGTMTARQRSPFTFDSDSSTLYSGGMGGYTANAPGSTPYKYAMYY